ncbi:hypothetical protein P7C70_g9453, partial [Phenoliferia sp. Uapishka_3]
MSDDLFADFGDFEPLENDNTAARAERIEKARLASSDYKAKLEPPGWFNAPTPSHNRNSIRNDLFRLHQLYFKGEYDQAVELGAGMLKSGGGGRKKMKGKKEEVMSEESEILDIILRSSLKSSKGVEQREVELARRYVLHSSSGLAYTSSLVLFRSSQSPSALPTPLEALEALLLAIQRRTLLSPYLTHLERILDASFPKLKETASAEEEMERIELSEEGRGVMRGLLKKLEGGEDEDEEEE